MKGIRCEEKPRGRRGGGEGEQGLPTESGSRHCLANVVRLPFFLAFLSTSHTPGSLRTTRLWEKGASHNAG